MSTTAQPLTIDCVSGEAVLSQERILTSQLPFVACVAVFLIDTIGWIFIPRQTCHTQILHYVSSQPKVSNKIC